MRGVTPDTPTYPAAVPRAAIRVQVLARYGSHARGQGQDLGISQPLSKTQWPHSLSSLLPRPPPHRTVSPSLWLLVSVH